MAGAGFCGSGAEGIWRAGSESFDYRGGRAGIESQDLWGLLFDSGLRSHVRIISGGVAVESGAASQFHGGCDLRRIRHNLVLVACVEEKRRAAKTGFLTQRPQRGARFAEKNLQSRDAKDLVTHLPLYRCSIRWQKVPKVSCTVPSLSWPSCC